MSDPDSPQPNYCSVWTCRTVPEGLEHKTHCETTGPSGTWTEPPPMGVYSCPAVEFGRNPWCPKEVDDKVDDTAPRPWDCKRIETGFSCSRTTGYSREKGWNCIENLGIRTCRTYDCTSAEAVCKNGTTAEPPGPRPVRGWNCQSTEFMRYCNSNPSAGEGEACPTDGVQRWCDGLAYCAWGKQHCIMKDGKKQWGPCIEGDPKNPPTDAPNTMCSCYFPASYNPMCCEDPKTCTITSTRAVPCEQMNGGALCAPCGDDRSCANGMFCQRNGRKAYDTPNGGAPFMAVEQFCTKACSTNAECGSGYTCTMPPGALMKTCMPNKGTCL